MRKIVVTENISLDGVMQAPAMPDEDTRGGFSRGGWANGYSDQVENASALPDDPACRSRIASMASRAERAPSMALPASQLTRICSRHAKVMAQGSWA